MAGAENDPVPGRAATSSPAGGYASGFRPELLAEHVRLRGVNERMRYVRPGRARSDERRYLVLCECGRERCRTRIEVSFSDYEQVRASLRRFVIAPLDEHLTADVRQVVSRGEAFWVVEVATAHGAGAVHAERTGRTSQRRASQELWKSLVPGDVPADGDPR